jgi:hypothetical protein
MVRRGKFLNRDVNFEFFRSVLRNFWNFLGNPMSPP